MQIWDDNTIKQAGAELGQAQFSYQLDTGLVWNLTHPYAYFLTCLIGCLLFTCLLPCLIDKMPFAYLLT